MTTDETSYPPLGPVEEALTTEVALNVLKDRKGGTSDGDETSRAPGRHLEDASETDANADNSQVLPACARCTGGTSGLLEDHVKDALMEYLSAQRERDSDWNFRAMTNFHAPRLLEKLQGALTTEDPHVRHVSISGDPKLNLRRDRTGFYNGEADLTVACTLVDGEAVEAVFLPAFAFSGIFRHPTDVASAWSTICSHLASELEMNQCDPGTSRILAAKLRDVHPDIAQRMGTSTKKGLSFVPDLDSSHVSHDSTDPASKARWCLRFKLTSNGTEKSGWFEAEVQTPSTGLPALSMSTSKKTLTQLGIRWELPADCVS